MYFKEFSADFNRRHGTMVPVSQTCPSGYCSLYYFLQHDAEKIMRAGSSKGLNQYPVFTNRLVMDFDNGDDTIWDDLSKIWDLGAPFRMYTSGGKGYHVEIHTEFMKGTHIPHSHKCFVEELGVHVDFGLYRHDRLLSNPGRVHPKTGLKKKIIFEVPHGKPLKIPEVIPVKKTPVIESNDSHMLRQGIGRLNSALALEPGIGDRHMLLWGVAKDLKLSGLDFETVLDLMLAVNNAWSTPKEPGEVEAAVSQAFDCFNLKRNLP